MWNRHLFLMAGGTSSEWEHWLEAQLARGARPPAAAPTTVTGATTSPTMTPFLGRRAAPKDSDYGVGTKQHSFWLERQLAPKQQQSVTSEQLKRSNELDAYNINLPASVNACIRGQDLSAINHRDWLEKQLNPTDGVRRIQRLDARIPERAAEPPQPANDDIALGSMAHQAWLQQQLLGRRA